MNREFPFNTSLRIGHLNRKNIGIAIFFYSQTFQLVCRESFSGEFGLYSRRLFVLHNRLAVDSERVEVGSDTRESNRSKYIMSLIDLRLLLDVGAKNEFLCSFESKILVRLGFSENILDVFPV